MNELQSFELTNRVKVQMSKEQIRRIEGKQLDPNGVAFLFVLRVLCVLPQPAVFMNTARQS